MFRMLRLRLSHNPLYEEMIGRIIDLPKIMDPRGNLTVAEGDSLVPFDIKRAYWVEYVAHTRRFLQWGGVSRAGF